MNKWQTALSVVLVIVVLVAGTKILLAPPKTEINLQMARAEGNPQAKVRIVEFIDFQCPACAFGIKYLKDLFCQTSL